MSTGDNETIESAINLELPINLLYDFATVAGTAQDAQTLMAHFFNLLRGEVEFDMAAYMIHSEGITEGRLFATSFLEKSKTSDFSRAFLKRGAQHFDGLPTNAITELAISILPQREWEAEKSRKVSQVHSHELQLKCFDDKAGVITLISYGRQNPFKPKTNLITSLAEHACRVLERIISLKVKENRKLSNILHTISEGIFLIDSNSYFTAVNPRSLEILSHFCNKHIDCIDRDFGLGKRLPKTNGSCEFTDFLKRARGYLNDPPASAHHEEIRNEDARILSLTLNNALLDESNNSSLILKVKDITEERLTQKAVLLSNKLASLGEMAAGIAHEINNPLQTILGNIEMLEVNINDEEIERLLRVKNGVLRIRSTVKDLLMFAREQTTDTESVDINSVMEQSHSILSKQLTRGGVDLQLELDTKPLAVKCNQNLLQQVMINLMQNAQDAIEESNRGSLITIRTALLPDKIVIIEVQDNGPGIPGAIISRIFEPLFTTKEVGKGTGLGLSLSRKIIKGFGGSIDVKSKRGKGTTFRISLPHHGSVMGVIDLKNEVEEDYSRLVDKTVLMVDDEEEILSTTRNAVAKNVFTIETVSSGVDAIERLKMRDYDFIFLDIRMPQMDGIKLYRNIIGNKPYLADRVIFLTGDVDNKRTAEFLRLTRSRFLAKPFGMKALLTAMCDIDKSIEAQKRQGI